MGSLEVVGCAGGDVATPSLSLGTTRVLEMAWTKGLCEENIKSFYNNLETLYTLHKILYTACGMLMRLAAR
jgi:hypothetical protein